MCGCLPVTAEGLLVVELPSGAAGGAALGVQVALALQTTVLAASCCNTTHLAVSMCGVADPVSTGVLHIPMCQHLVPCM